MLSARYHLAYWAAAFSAAAVYQLLHRLPGMIYACRIALPLLVFYIPPVAWQWSIPGKKATDWQLIIHQAAVAHLLVALGSITNYYDVGNGGQVPAMAIHALFAFTAVGTLESLRQNVCAQFPTCSTPLTHVLQRDDIQPRSLGLFVGSGMRYDLSKVNHRLPGSTFRDTARVFGAKAVIVVVNIGLQTSMAYGILRLADWHWGTSLSKTIPILHDDYPLKGRLGSALMTMFVLTPILDMAETVSAPFLEAFECLPSDEPPTTDVLIPEPCSSSTSSYGNL